MKLLIALSAFVLFLTSCQRDSELAEQIIDNLNDTSTILTKKTIFHGGLPGEDSVLTVYKNNTINGVKGFIINDTGYTLHTSCVSTFIYDSKDRLTDIITKSSDGTPGSLSVATRKISWQDSYIKNIKWVEDGIVRMNRNFLYEIFGDTLFVEYDINLGGNIYLDSSHYVLFADISQQKIKGFFSTKIFDYRNIFLSSFGSSYSQTKFTYSNTNISTISNYGETFYNVSPFPYTHVIDSTVFYLNRKPGVNPFIYELENRIFGKEIRLLSYDKDSVSWWYNEFFGSIYIDYGNQASTLYYYDDIYTIITNPLEIATINSVVRRDGIVTDSRTNYPVAKFSYVVDGMNRIIMIKNYDVNTNQLLSESHFTYPL